DHGRLRRVDLREGSTETVTRQAGTSAWRVTARLLFLVVAAVTLYALMPRLVDVWSELPRLRDIGWWWFPVMLGLEVASVACLWQLARLAIPGVSLFQAATGQLVGNAISKCVPGGGPVGAATQMRMFSVSGVELSTAVSALGAAGLVSTWVLFALPAVALLVSLVGSPVPQGMVHVAWGGAAVFVVMF